MTTLTHLECSACGQTYEPDRLTGLCSCGQPLLARYDLERARKTWNRAWLANAPSNMWRYAPVLPLRSPERAVSLGEGFTPVLPLQRLASRLGMKDLWLKDESLNPTGTFKARGLACAVSRARELGVHVLAIPSAGNAAGALAAYAAAAGLTARVVIPSDVPEANYIECVAYGAQVTLLDGLISDCARWVAEQALEKGWYDVSTFREPYRVEGKKTLGYEIAEQFHWRLPDAIVYPTGGGVGLVGMWKAFEELASLGWIGPARPKMIVVQAAGCQPLVRAFETGASRCEPWPEAHTLAAGLRVPKPLADALILHILRQSRGSAVAVTDQEILDAALDLARTEGVFPAPEGAACAAALPHLLKKGIVSPDERVLLINTGSGLKYLDVFRTRIPPAHLTEARKQGGLITPR